jgi:hypothetical protein
MAKIKDTIIVTFASIEETYLLKLPSLVTYSNELSKIEAIKERKDRIYENFFLVIPHHKRY